MIDEEVSIQLCHFPANHSVTISAIAQNSSGAAFHSHAIFETDAEGFVDVRTQHPIAGTYEMADPMGLFWSMEPVPESVRRKGREFELLMPWLVDLAATVNDEILDAVQLKRLLVHPDVTRQPMRDDGLVGTFFIPGGQGPFPTLLVLSGSNGGRLETLAALLASRGYAALALAYFQAESLPKDLCGIPLEYFEQAIDWLQSQELVMEDKLGVVGFSRGGELALLLGATFSEIRAVVSYVGSGYTHRSVTTSGVKNRAAWTYKGQPLPFRKGHTDTAAEGAIIPAERIHGPVLLISGKDDRLWPSATYSEVARLRLEEHAHPFPYEHLSYEGAGHLIRPPYRPTTVLKSYHPVSGKFNSFGGNPKDTAFASLDSWRRVREFLKQSLGKD